MHTLKIGRALAVGLLVLSPKAGLGAGVGLIPCNGSSITIPLVGTVSTGTPAITSVTSMIFNPYNSATAAAAMATNTIIISCVGSSVSISPVPSLPAFTLTLSAGNSGTFGPRKMTAAGNTTPLPYNIYTTSTYPGGSIWGNGTGGSVTQTYGGLLAASSQTYTGYGVIPAGQRVMAGSYSDIITITLTY